MPKKPLYILCQHEGCKIPAATKIEGYYRCAEHLSAAPALLSVPVKPESKKYVHPEGKRAVSKQSIYCAISGCIYEPFAQPVDRSGMYCKGHYEAHTRRGNARIFDTERIDAVHNSIEEQINLGFLYIQAPKDTPDWSQLKDIGGLHE